jgi:hypothetical protein
MKMNSKLKILLLLLVCFQAGFSQKNNDASILKILLTKYYANQKVIVKNRFQFLSLYCNKAPNNEETFEVIGKSDLLKQHQATIKSQVNNRLEENWSNELTEIFTNQNQYLKSKVNNCLSLDDFQKLTADHGDNNQKLMIVSKPIYFGEKYCLVKVAFYRSIEHNSGCFILLENTNSVWTIKEYLNEWST